MRSSVVVVTAGEDANVGLGDLVHQAVLLVDASGPATREFVLEGLRLADAAERIGLCLQDDSQNAQGFLAVFLHPPHQFEGSGVKLQDALGLLQMKSPSFAFWPPIGAC